MLKAIDDLKAKGFRPDQVQEKVAPLCDQHLKGATSEESMRKDLVSHHILRLAYCRTEELRRWFITQVGVRGKAQWGGWVGVRWGLGWVGRWVPRKVLKECHPTAPKHPIVHPSHMTPLTRPSACTPPGVRAVPRPLPRPAALRPAGLHGAGTPALPPHQQGGV